MNVLLVASHANLQPANSFRLSICPYVRLSIRRFAGWLVPFLLFGRFWPFWAYCPYPNAPVTLSFTVPYRPYATKEVVYLAMFSSMGSSGQKVQSTLEKNVPLW